MLTRDREIKIKVMLFLFCFIILFVSGCVSPAKMQEKAKQATRSGFVTEIDEPSSQGVLTRISPEECNLMFRFCLSPDNKLIVFSAIPGRNNAFSKGTYNLAQLWQIS